MESPSTQLRIDRIRGVTEEVVRQIVGGELEPEAVIILVGSEAHLQRTILFPDEKDLNFVVASRSLVKDA